MANVKDEGLLEVTHPRELKSYNILEFLPYAGGDPKPYAFAYNTSIGKEVHKEEVKLFGHFVIRTLYLVKLNKPEVYGGL